MTHFGAINLFLFYSTFPGVWIHACSSGSYGYKKKPHNGGLVLFSSFLLLEILDTTDVDDQSKDACSSCTEIEKVAVVPLLYKAQYDKDCADDDQSQAQIFCEIFHFGIYFVFILFFCKETYKYL